MPSNTTNEHENKEENDRKSEKATIKYLMQTIENLQKEREVLKHEALRSERPPSEKTGIILLIVGALTLVGSVAGNSQALAFIGLGLTFWGALFLFARPVKFVRGTLLDSTAISTYATIDRMIQDLGYKGKPIYIPPYPKEAYLPEYLKGLKEMIVFISAADVAKMPTLDEMAKKQFLLKNPQGICIAPPGNGLINLFEKELRTGFTQINLERLFNSLPALITKNLELAREFEISSDNEVIHIRLVDSAYQDLYSDEQGFKSIHSIGCPLASAIACALAKTTAKLVTIVKDEVSYDLKTIQVWYQTLESA